MPVEKFRCIADLPPPPPSPSEGLGARVVAVWRRAFALAEPLGVRGVRRFTSIEEAAEARARATLERMRASR